MADLWGFWGLFGTGVEALGVGLCRVLGGLGFSFLGVVEDLRVFGFWGCRVHSGVDSWA